jgi:hypothetical protein
VSKSWRANYDLRTPRCPERGRARGQDRVGPGGALGWPGRVRWVSQSFGTALLTALITVDNAQFFADRSAIVDGRGANADPSVQQMIQDGSGRLSGYWQQISNKAQTAAYSQIHAPTDGLVVGWRVAPVPP